MATVNIIPMPAAYRTIRKKIFRPQPPPLFGDDSPVTLEDIELARALFKELDPESQEWYGRRGIFRDLECKPPKGKKP